MKISILVLLGLVCGLPFTYGQCDDLVVNAGMDINICPGDEINLSGDIQGTYSKFNWEPTDLVSDPSSLDTRAFQTGNYKLTAFNKDNVNLVTNGDFSQGNNGFTSQYNYQPLLGGAIGYGGYAVGSNPNLYNVGWDNCNDVTGEGEMFIGDGGVVSVLDAWCQTIAINPGRFYYFSFNSTSIWNDPSPAQYNVTFNGTNVGSFSDSGSSCNWDLHELEWFSGGASSVTICIQNSNLTSFGNDFALDDIRLYGSCTVEDEVTVIEVLMPLDAPDKYTLSCNNNIIDLLLTSYPQVGPYIVNWTTDDGNIVSSLPIPPYTATVNSPGTYIAELVYNDGATECRKEIEVYVEEAETELDAIPEEEKAIECASYGILIAQGTTVNFEYTWYADPGNIISNPDSTTILVSTEGFYYLVEYDPITGCRDTSELEVIPSPDFPNAEILNNDTINCANRNTFVLNGNSSSLTPNDKFEWTTIDGSFSGNTDNLITGISSTGTYTLSIIDTLTGCADTAHITVFGDFEEPIAIFPDTLLIDCQNTQLEVSNTLINTMDVNYNWIQNGNIFTSDTLSINQAGQIIVQTIHTSNGCLVTDTIEVISNSNIPAISFENNLILNCINNEIDILLNESYDPSLSYDWNTSEGNIISISDTNSIQVNQDGVYYILITNSDNNCSALDSIEVLADFSLPTVSTQDTSYLPCGVASIIIQATTDLLFPNLQYQWETSNGSFLTTPFSDQLEVDAPGDYQFIIFNPNNGCSDTVIHTVVPDQNVPVLTTTGFDTIDCTTLSIRLSAIGVSNTGANISYNWSTTNGNIIGNSNTPDINIQEPGTYRIEITDDNNNCINVSTITIDIDTIAPIISFASDVNIDCSSQTINLQSEQADNPQFSYNWSTTDGTLPSNSNISSIEVSSAGTYTLEVFNPQNSCSNDKTIIVGIDTITPLAMVLSPQILTCQQTSIVLDASSSDIGSAFFFGWSYPDGNNIDFSDPLRPIITEEGSYTLTVQNILNNCIDSAVVIITSNQEYPKILLNDPDSLGCNHPNSSITAMVTSSAGYNTNWTTSNGNITSDTSSNSIIVDQQGLYFITVEDLDNSCVTIDSIFISGMASGPTEFQLDINNGVCFEDISSYTVLNIIGGEAPYQAELNGQAITLDQQLDITPGDYILVVSDDNDCRISDTFTIFPAQQYPINIGLDFQITAGDPTRLTPQFGFDTTTIASLQWLPSDAVSCDSCFVTNFIASQSTEVTLLAITDDGCQAFADIFITVIPGKDVFIPSAFSPNADKLNDFLTVFAKNGRVTQVKSLAVYNRWGDQVFLKENFQPNLEDQGWDGKHHGIELDPGVFIFAAEVEFIDGSIRLFAGDVTLVK